MISHDQLHHELLPHYCEKLINTFRSCRPTINHCTARGTLLPIGYFLEVTVTIDNEYQVHAFPLRVPAEDRDVLRQLNEIFGLVQRHLMTLTAQQINFTNGSSLVVGYDPARGSDRTGINLWSASDAFGVPEPTTKSEDWSTIALLERCLKESTT